LKHFLTIKLPAILLLPALGWGSIGPVGAGHCPRPQWDMNGISIVIAGRRGDLPLRDLDPFTSGALAEVPLGALQSPLVMHPFLSKTSAEFPPIRLSAVHVLRSPSLTELDIKEEIHSVGQMMVRQLADAFAPWNNSMLNVADVENALKSAYNSGFYTLIKRLKGLALQYWLVKNDEETWAKSMRGVENDLCKGMTEILVAALDKNQILAVPREFMPPDDIQGDIIPKHDVALIEEMIIADLTFGQFDPHYAGWFVVDGDLLHFKRRLDRAMRDADRRWTSDPNLKSSQMLQAYQVEVAA
jgi:hypothetical protein